MKNIILQKRGANFFGYESIDERGKHHCHLKVVRGRGDLSLAKEGIYFNQWITKKEYFIPLKKITKLEIKKGHNLKVMWPGKVLRIYYKDGNQTKIFGIALGGKLSLAKGWQDDAYKWKKKIESLLG